MSAERPSGATTQAALLYGLVGLSALLVALWPRQVLRDRGVTLRNLFSELKVLWVVLPGFASAYVVRTLACLARREYRVSYAIFGVVAISAVVFLADIRLRAVVTQGETLQWLARAWPIMSVINGMVTVLVGELWTHLASPPHQRSHRPMLLIGLVVCGLLAGVRLVFGW